MQRFFFPSRLHIRVAKVYCQNDRCSNISGKHTGVQVNIKSTQHLTIHMHSVPQKWNLSISKACTVRKVIAILKETMNEIRKFTK